MARDYAALPHEYLEEMEELSDAEFGRLCRSLLEYSMTGTPIALCGNERFYARRVMRREDFYQGNYSEKAKTSRANGTKGGRPRKPKASSENPENPVGSDENLKNTVGFPETQKTEDKNKNNNKDNIAAAAAIGACAREAAAADASTGSEAFAYYQDRISFNMSREAVSLLQHYIQSMGDEVVIAAIDEALNNGAPKWSYVKAILKNWSAAKVHNMESLQRHMDSRKRQPLPGKHRKSIGPEPYREPTPEEKARHEQELEENQRELKALLKSMNMWEGDDGNEGPGN